MLPPHHDLSVVRLPHTARRTVKGRSGRPSMRRPAESWARCPSAHGRKERPCKASRGSSESWRQSTLRTSVSWRRGRRRRSSSRAQQQVPYLVAHGSSTSHSASGRKAHAARVRGMCSSSVFYTFAKDRVVLPQEHMYLLGWEARFCKPAAAHSSPIAGDERRKHGCSMHSSDHPRISFAVGTLVDDSSVASIKLGALPKDSVF